jgi:hypothetical protein
MLAMLASPGSTTIRRNRFNGSGIPADIVIEATEPRVTKATAKTANARSGATAAVVIGEELRGENLPDVPV